MSGRFSSKSILAGLLLIATVVVLSLLSHNWPDSALSQERRTVTSAEPGQKEPTPSASDSATRQQQRAAIRVLLQRRLEQKEARSQEAVLTFDTEEAYRKFLARAAGAGLDIRGQLDRLRTVRVGYASLDPLFGDMLGNPSDYLGVDANFLVQVPGIPAAEDRPRVGQVPLGNNTLSFLGVAGDHSQWGRGVTVAVLDTGVAADATLGTGRVQYLDAGLGIMPNTGKDDGHGTAVAGLVAGAALDAPGVASAAGILSIRITDADGTSDNFTLAKGIVTAVDAGASIINISMGSHASSTVLSSAIDYASAQGAIIVAAAGNDGAAQLTWPAADPRVVSVGAVDALEQQVYFSNAGPQLKITAPGYGVDAAWLNSQRVSMDGTSASAPLVAGAIAAVMSTSPGLTAAQAWSVLQQYASDGGAPGPDPAYGNGILNLGWAMDRNNPTRVDTAIAGQYYDASTGMMNVVVQNRGAQAANDLKLNMDIGNVATDHQIPPLSPGATYLVQTPVNSEQLAAAGGINYRAQLINPSPAADQMPTNNVKIGVILAPAK